MVHFLPIIVSCILAIYYRDNEILCVSMVVVGIMVHIFDYLSMDERLRKSIDRRLSGVDSNIFEINTRIRKNMVEHCQLKESFDHNDAITAKMIKDLREEVQSLKSKIDIMVSSSSGRSEGPFGG